MPHGVREVDQQATVSYLMCWHACTHWTITWDSQKHMNCNENNHMYIKQTILNMQDKKTIYTIFMIYYLQFRHVSSKTT